METFPASKPPAVESNSPQNLSTPNHIMSKKRPKLSKGEMDVARTLWDLGMATVGQIHEAMPEHRQMDYTTVQTYIRRLEDKGYLKARREGRTKIYSARVRPGTVIGETINDLMEQLFDGEMIPLVKHLVDDRGITEDEIDQIRQLLDQVEQQNVNDT
jgi:predicted transcriptional regulator